MNKHIASHWDVKNKRLVEVYSYTPNRNAQSAEPDTYEFQSQGGDRVPNALIRELQDEHQANLHVSETAEESNAWLDSYPDQCDDEQDGMRTMTEAEFLMEAAQDAHYPELGEQVYAD